MAPADVQDQQPGSTPQDDINFVKEAFHSQYNWIALAGAGAFALVSGTFLPIILGGGTGADVPRHRSAKLAFSAAGAILEIRRGATEAPAKAERNAARTCRPEMQSRYVHAAQVCGSIRANFAQLSSHRRSFCSKSIRSLQGLLNGYARLLLAAAQQQQYVKSTEQDGIKHEIASLQKTLSSDPPKVQEINQKRIEILTKRLEKFDKISENRKVVDAQCSAVEDVLMLVRDQSVTMRDPQQVSERLDSLVHDVEQTEQTVQQVEAIFSDMSPDLDGLMSLDDTSTSSGPNRVRMSN